MHLKNYIFTLPTDLHKELKIICAKEGYKMSYFVRVAIEEKIKAINIAKNKDNEIIGTKFID